jgi:hypothetical protein
VVLIALVEDGVQDLLGLDLAEQVLGPEPMGDSVGGLLELFVLWQRHHLLQGVIEVLLVVVEGRVADLPDFLHLPSLLPALPLRQQGMVLIVLQAGTLPACRPGVVG